jgi:glycine cleavage system H protein
MSILFVLLMFVVVMTFNYFYFRRPEVQPGVDAALWTAPKAPSMRREFGFEIPQGYSFHPGHTWVLKEGTDRARVGVDSFAGNLVGKVDRVDVIGLNRWVRQGQKLMTLTANGKRYDLLSPVEGVITAVNNDVVKDPALVNQDPYKDGWIALVKSPDLSINQKNLVQGTMVAPWMQNNVSRLNAMLSQLSPVMAQDGGLPVNGLLSKLTPEMEEKITKEFLLA